MGTATRAHGEIPGESTEEERLAALKEFHNFGMGRDQYYVNITFKACSNAEVEKSGIRGKQPPRLDAYFDWTRNTLPAVRRAFEARGNQKHLFTTARSLGFDEPST